MQFKIFFLTIFFLFPSIVLAEDIHLSQSITSDWASGFCNNVSLKNIGTTDIAWSELHFTLNNATITSLWGGNYTSTNGVYTVKPASWNTTIVAGDTALVGYCANGSGRPTDLSILNEHPLLPSSGVRPNNITLNKDGLSLNSTITSDWKTGYCRNVVLKNTMSVPITNWIISFDISSEINLWSANKIKNGNTFIISPKSWNSNLGQTEFGFCVSSDAVDSNWNIVNIETGTATPLPTPVNGNCGNDHNKILSYTPTNLCANGVSSPLTGTGPWNWICKGINNGTNENCQAYKLIVTPTPTPTPIPTPIPTPTPTATRVSFSIDPNSGRKRISPYIYGRNFGDNNIENFGASRLGGNRLTGYNWENNASNAGSDWNHSSDGYLSESNTPGATFTDFIDKNKQIGIPYSLLTLQMAGYVAHDKNGTVTETESAPSNRFDKVINTKGSLFSLKPNLNDGRVYMDEFVNLIVNRYGISSNTGTMRGYSLDNEPGLWASTHPRIHSNKTTIAEMISQSVSLALAVKAVDKSADIFGAVTYGFGEQYNLQDAPDWDLYKTKYPTYLDAYLAGLKKASVDAKIRLLNVLDIHWYPEARGIAKNGQKIRITENNTDPGVAFARMQAPRSLWDPTYVEDSWIGQWFTAEAFPLIPKLKKSISDNYIGTKLSISEFDYGAPDHISGGIALADVLGIFGKNNIYFASYWGDIKGYVSSAYKLYRNYDGANSTFGDISIATTNEDTVNTSIYASIDRNTGKTHIILINKQNNSLTARINLNNIAIQSGDVYGFDESTPTIRKIGTVISSGGIIEYTLLPTSAVHIVLDKS